MNESQTEEEKQSNKRMKKEDNNKMSKTIHEKKDISLNMLSFVRTLNESTKGKMIVIEAKHEDQKAVVIMEKIAFSEDNVKQILNDANDCNTRLECHFHNDIYGNYMAFPNTRFNPIKTTIIHPASDRHIHKYSSQTIYLVLETQETYESITLPHIQAQHFSLEWVDNILNHKSETERIVCDDCDPDIGFVLLPDMKWDGKQLSNLYLVAISRKYNIKSLRDLNVKHLDLLNNIKNKGSDAIQRKYGINRNLIRIYIHYQPSYYHFHVHFTALTHEDSGSNVERAHLLDTVINNITLCSHYYQKSTLSFPLKQNDSLYSVFENKNLLNS